MAISRDNAALARSLGLQVTNVGAGPGEEAFIVRDPRTNQRLNQTGVTQAQLTGLLAGRGARVSGPVEAPRPAATGRSSSGGGGGGDAAASQAISDIPIPTKPTPPTLKAAPITESENEILDTANKLLEGTKAAQATKVDTTGLDTAQAQKFDVEKAEATRVAGQERTADAAQLAAPSNIVGDLTQTTSQEAIAEAQIENLDQKATVQFQLEQLYEGFKNGQIPPWASGAARTASNIMASRGLGASSIAAAAIAQSIQEGAIPIASADAQSFATIQLQNLTNKQQATLANAATFAALDRANLDARTTAAVTNAQSFLAIDTANLTNKQQTELFNNEARNQFLLSDQAAANAFEQLNTENQVDVDKFFAQLGTQIEEANNTRVAALRQFNAEQENTISIFNTKTADQRERFNAEVQTQIAAANTQWRRTITTINNANQQEVNKFAAESTLTFDLTEYNQLWQKYRDDVARIFTTSENSLQRDNNIAIAQLSANTARQNRSSASTSSALGAVASIAGAVITASSDVRLKENIYKIGTHPQGFGIYIWDWNKKAFKIGIKGISSIGVLAQELIEYRPNLVYKDSTGYFKVNYFGLLRG